MQKIVISAIGKDKPGIVSGVTGILYRHGASIEDSSMSILEENFAMIMIVALPPKSSASALTRDFKKLEKKLSLVISISIPKNKPHVGSSRAKGMPYIVSVLGADKPGIVHRVSKLLADHMANITDLNTKVIGKEGTKNVYAMVLEIELPPAVSFPSLQRKLGRLGKAIKVDVTCRPVETLTL